MLRALMKEEKDTEVLAELSKGTLRKKIPQLRRALEGQVTAHHRSLLTGHWNRMEFLEQQIADFETQIDQRMKPTPEEMALTVHNAAEEAPPPLSPREEAIQLWMEIPGIGWTAACSMVAELGVHMDQFPWAAHVASWAGLCPGDMAQSVPLSLQPTASYVPFLSLLKTGQPYSEAARAHYPKLYVSRKAQHLCVQLRNRGFHVMLKPKEQPVWRRFVFVTESLF